MIQVDAWPVITPLMVLAIIGVWKLLVSGIKWISHEVAENVVAAIGDTLSARWNSDMNKALAPIYAELQDNGGNSLKDKVRSIDDRLHNVEQQLETEIIRGHFDGDIEGTPI